MTSSAQELFGKAAAEMEQALADALQTAVDMEHPDTEFIERLLKLIIKKEIILELLLEEIRHLD